MLQRRRQGCELLTNYGKTGMSFFRPRRRSGGLGRPSAPSQLPARGGGLCTPDNLFGLVQQLLALLMQGAILPGQLARRIFRQFPAALAKILAFLDQFLACVDQVVCGLFSLAD